MDIAGVSRLNSVDISMCIDPDNTCIGVRAVLNCKSSVNYLETDEALRQCPRNSAHCEGMVSAQCDGELALGAVRADSLRDALSNAGHQTRVLQQADGRVSDKACVEVIGVLCGDILELVVPVKFDLPAESFELVNEACLDKVNGASIYTWLWLDKDVSNPYRT